MFFDEIASDQLKSFLVRKLEPICDADPLVLAEYVIALLKHDKPVSELREVCVLQLNDFMAPGHVVPFVNMLFRRLEGSEEEEMRDAAVSDARDAGDDREDDGRDRRYRDSRRRHRDDYRSSRSDRDEYRSRGDRDRRRHAPYKSEDRFRNRLGRRSPSDKPGDTLVVQNIPLDNCNVGDVTNYFSRFGSVLNVKVDLAEKKASVMFSSHEEARQAYECPDVIFGNRFVKVFWLKNEFQDVDPEAAAARQADKERRIQEQNVVAQEKLREMLAQQKEKKLAVQRGREMLLQKQLEEQKKLMARLDDPSLDAEEKKQILHSLNLLAESAKSLYRG